jgi:hypothetical protein
VVARDDRVGDVGVIELLHRPVGRLPLPARADPVDDVADVGDEGDVELGGVLGDELGLGRERVAAVAREELVTGVARVELRVREDREGESRRPVCVVYVDGGVRDGGAWKAQRGQDRGGGQPRGRELAGCGEEMHFAPIIVRGFRPISRTCARSPQC